MQRHALLILAIAILTFGCTGTRVGPEPKSSVDARQAPVEPVYVNDEAFGPRVHELLLDGGFSSKRTNLLAGVVRRQLERAGRLFRSGQVQAGMNAVRGAFYLVRAGEFDDSMLSGQSFALSKASEEAARSGSEGQSLALYRMLKSALPDQSQAEQDVDEHLQALERWQQASQQASSLVAAGAWQRASVQRALLEPVPEALGKATQATRDWVQGALDSNVGEQPVTTPAERAEAVEYFRASRAAGLELIALYLRHGDPAGLLQALDETELIRVIPPAWTSRLETIAEKPDAEVWLELFGQLQNRAEPRQSEADVNPELMQAGAWGAAVALFRTAPNDLRSAMPLAMTLTHYGMAEVAPLVLAGAFDESASAEELSWALSLLLRIIVTEEELGQLDSARRTFEHAAPLLRLASSPKFRKEVQPSFARLHYVMGALETRGGELELARPHVEAAAKAEPSVEAYMALAAINRQKNRKDEAILALNKVLELAEAQSEPIAQGEALLTLFEIYRDASEPEQAKRALREALHRALAGQRLAKSAPNQARAERLLARILEHYGDTRGARRATERAYEASRYDQRQMSMTVLDASRRALTHRDLRAARDAVRRAIDANLPAEDMVYAALWLQMLERMLGVPSDGTAEEALSYIDDASGWPARLRAWSLGKLSDDELLEAAQNRVERTEALFYTALSKHASGKARVALQKLEKVAKSEAIELVEVRIARDLVAEHGQGKLDVTLPSDVTLP